MIAAVVDSPPAADPADILSPEWHAHAGAIDDARAAAAADPAAAVADPAAAAADPAAAAAAAAANLESELADFLGLAVAALAPAFPRLAPIWPPEVCKQFAAAFVPVAIKHDWHFTFAAYAEEFRLGLVVAPLLVPTIKALKFEPAAAPAQPGPQNEKAQSGAAAVAFVKPASTAAAA